MIEDTVFVSRTASLDESIDAEELQKMGYKMMTNDEMKNNCAKKTTCTEAEIKKFVQKNETNNIKILKEWSRRD